MVPSDQTMAVSPSFQRLLINTLVSTALIIGIVWRSARWREQVLYDHMHTVTNSTMSKLLAAVANERGEFVFATYWGFEQEKIPMLRTWLYHLANTGALHHTLVLTADVDTMRWLRSMGAPGFLDLATPKNPEFRYQPAIDSSPNT
jgi:hypothetical protein